jgi:hypothetical protein
MTRRGRSGRKVFLALSVLVAIGAGLPSDALAQQAPPSCEELDVHRQWDFWIGDWDVVVNDSTRAPAGTNTITSRHNGCMLQEEWRSVTGGTGSSINFFDGARGVWRQVWVAAAYVIEIEGGLDDAGAMVLEGELRTFVSGTTSPFRGIWTELEPGVVNQRFELQSPEGEWSVWFDGLYVRTK